MERVLVAGSTGHLGKQVLREFKERGYWVRAVARDPGKLANWKAWVDDIFVGDITKPQTLAAAFDGIEVVFSSAGASVSPARQRGRASFREVDYHGNLNLLTAATKTPSRKFVYVSVFRGPLSEDLEYIKAHEDFVSVLKGSGLEYAILRPTGYFWSWAEALKMAASGRVFMAGDLETKENPIHEADLATVCVDAATGREREIAVGGPDALTRREIIELAFSTLAKEPKIITLPLWLVNAIVKAIRPFDRRMSELFAFIAATMQVDLVAPQTGTHTLRGYFEEIAPGLKHSDVILSRM